MSSLDSKIPSGPIEKKWTDHKNHMKLVAPNNRPKIDVIVIVTGLAGASASASLGEMGYNVKTGEYGDLYKMGVIDPVKVTRSALQNAVSVAVTMLSTDAIVTMARTYEAQ